MCRSLSGTEANVIPFSYNVPPSFPKELLPLIPNRYIHTHIVNMCVYIYRERERERAIASYSK